MSYELVRVHAKLLAELQRDESSPVVVIGAEQQEDGTYELTFRRVDPLADLLEAPIEDPGEFPAGAEIPPAQILTVLEGKVIGRQELVARDYVLVCGPDCFVSHVNHFSSGTDQVTIKKERPR